MAFRRGGTGPEEGLRPRGRIAHAAMVPKIRQVQIRNYRSIGRTVVDLEPFTVLVGANGTGKSNFLGALSFTQECLSLSPRHALQNHGGKRIAAQWEKGWLGLRFLLEISEGVSADYSFALALPSEEDRLPVVSVTHERCVVRRDDEPDVSFEVTDGRFLREIPGIRPQISPDRLALFAAAATDEFRPVYDFLNAMRLYDVKPESLAYSRSSEAEDFLAFDGNNAASVLKSLQEQAPERYERVVRLLSLAVEGIQQVSTQVSHGRASLEFKKDIGLAEPGRFSGWDMSAGTMRVLGLLLAVYQPQSPSLIAIEEPEATVHPAIAELVLQVLLDASRDRQIVITTHSPDLLDAKELDDRQIRVVTIEHGRTSVAPLSRASREAIREHLYTPGELLRSNELSQDVQAAEESAQRLDLFEAIRPAPVS